ncbi:MAG: membrane protein insertase YidC [Syntrophobacterales bacterium]|jgi:YidC/Oxa1 family membrane protein insertase|nr:membrane protein insertase YidC [Syntrophobacterales bacterium]
MEKRNIILLGLTIILLFFFQMYFSPKEPQKQPAQSSGQVEQAPGKSEEAKATVPSTSGGIPQPSVKGLSVQKPTRTITAETDLLQVTFTDLGGGISSVKLKKYRQTVKRPDDKEIIEDVKPYIYLPRTFATVASGLATDETIFKPDKDAVRTQDKPETIVFSGTLTDGRSVRKTYTFHPGIYTIDMKVEVAGVDAARTDMDFAAITAKRESSYTFKGPFYYAGNKFEQVDKLDNNVILGKAYKYAGLDDGFFTFIWIPNTDSLPAATIMKGDNDIPVIRLALAGGTTSGKMYFGPKKTDILKTLNVGAEKIVDFGWFDIIAKPMILGMNYCNKITHNYGIDIILLTILIKFIFYPLSVKSYKSMKEMQKIQPMIAKLREKYKDDKQKLNQEMMEIYKTKGINPMGGCLPMIIQIPVFFALYKALSAAIELRHAPFMLWINDLSSPEDLYTIHVAGYELPVRLLPIVMGATQVIQQKMTPSGGDPMQQKLMLAMPIVFTFIFWGFPSGLVLYWLVNNVISIAQQYYINKKVS